MDDLKSLRVAAQIEQIQFEVETEIQRTLDAQIVAKYLTAKGVYTTDKDELLSHLDAGFLAQFPTFVARIVMENGAIPPEVPVAIRKKQFKVRGEIWTVHQDDVDPFPSSPHAHNYEQNLVMHLGNGNLYRKRHFIAKANRKRFLELRNRIDHLALPPLEVDD